MSRAPVPGGLLSWLRKAIGAIALLLDRVCLGVVVLLLLSILVTTVLAVFFRYVLNSPLLWTDEVGRYTMIWLAYLGAPVALRRRGHIALEWLYERLPKVCRKSLDVTIRLITGTIFGVVLCVSFPILQRLSHSHSPMMRIPMVAAYASVAVGSALIVIQSLDLLLSDVVKRGDQ